MWALFYEGGQVSREYPDEAAVWRALRQAGMLNEDLFDEGYEIRRVEPERESLFADGDANDLRNKPMLRLAKASRSAMTATT